MMSGGDVREVSLSDPPQGLTATITDLTTHRTGIAVAGAANGFMNTNIADCSRTPFTFHAEYNTARPQNQVPWPALEGGVLVEQEIGHGEACNSLANKDPFSATYPGGQSDSDPTVLDTCNGGSEGATAAGEGPCSGTICQNATTQGPTGPTACPVDGAASGALCEFADGYCFPKGDRTALVNGTPTTESSPLDSCFNDRFQNGDLDFEGTDYVSNTWPDGTANQPTPPSYTGPFTSGGRTYPRVQFESDVGGSSNLCDPATGAGCTVPPISAQFYPYWSLAGSSGSQPPAPRGTCDWDFGKTIAGVTAQHFGGDVQYGTPDVARYGGTIISAPRPNPEVGARCRGRHF